MQASFLTGSAPFAHCYEAEKPKMKIVGTVGEMDPTDDGTKTLDDDEESVDKLEEMTRVARHLQAIVLQDRAEKEN